MISTLPELPFNPSLADVVLTALVLVIVLGPVRWLLMRWLGPLFALEMSRLSHRGSLWWMRVGYAGALLIALAVTFPADVSLSPNAQAEFATAFAELFLLIQAITVLVLTPLLFAGAISDEKESRSLDFLLTSHLTAREIILGKYAARVLALVGVLLTGLPVLALTLLFGGVDLAHLLTLFALTVLSLLSLGAISVWLSVECRHTVQATGLALAVSVGMSLFCAGLLVTPLDYLQRVTRNKQTQGIVGVPAPRPAIREAILEHGAIASVALLMATIRLRRRANPLEPRPPHIVRGVNRTIIVPSTASRASLPLTEWHPIGRFAVAWKENYVGRRGETLADALWLYFAVGSFLLTAGAFYSLGATQFRNEQRIVFVGLAIFLTAGLSLGLLLQLAGTITREYERRTLESLLATPLPPARILGEKLLGAMQRRIRWGIALLVLLLIATCSGTFSLLSAVLIGLLAIAYSTFAATLGLFISSLARTTIRAHVIAAITLAVLFAVTGVLARFRGGNHASSTMQLATALNPVSAWDMVRRFNTTDGAGAEMLVLSLLAAIAIILMTAIILVAASYWRLRRWDRDA